MYKRLWLWATILTGILNAVGFYNIVLFDTNMFDWLKPFITTSTQEYILLFFLLAISLAPVIMFRLYLKYVTDKDLTKVETELVGLAFSPPGTSFLTLRDLAQALSLFAYMTSIWYVGLTVLSILSLPHR